MHNLDAYQQTEKVMKLIGPDKYTLVIKDRQALVQSSDGKSHFVTPATKNKKPKLYIVSKEGQLLYIGVTSQSMSARLRGGLTADGEHGYHGYSWGREDHSIQLDIWYLIESANPIRDAETIEAETVFLSRLKSGQWPLAQTEIHFYSSGEEHRQCAQQILAHLNKKGSS